MTRTDNLWTGFLPQWVIANAFGWLLYAFVEALPFGYISFSIGVGLFIGCVQWIVLRKHMRVDSMWIWASTVVYAAYIFSFGVLVNGSFGKLLFLTVIILGLMGLLQRYVLDYYVNQSVLWVFVSCIAGIVSFIFVLIFENILLVERSLPVIWAIYGIIYGSITGVALTFLYTKTMNKKTLQ